jgi:UDP-N-acetylglucosamine--N-acetylmuramyl-(pentapeptide) pyrophosphoryl-undecaprenol N-acetylglucosamine transferase
MADVLLLTGSVLVLLYIALFAASRLKRKGSSKRAVLTGGGSAGHIYPAIAIGRALTPDVSEFLYLGTRHRAEEKVVPQEGIPIKFIPSAPYPGISFRMPVFSVKLLLGIIKSSWHLFTFQPKYVIGTGGFVSAPVVMAAFLLNSAMLLRSKIYLHEQNVAPGKLNLVAGRIADKVMVTFPESLVFFKKNGILTGYPLRNTIIKENIEEAKKKLPFGDPGSRMVIFAFGGSQGSRTINRAVVDALRYLIPFKDKVFVVLSAGLGQSVYQGRDDVQKRIVAKYSDAERKEIEAFFYCDTYFHDVSSVFSVSSLVISRSGAGALFELAALGIPSILIPKFGLAGEHQVMNAQAMERAGGAFIFYEKPLAEAGSITEGADGKELAEKIISLSGSSGNLAEMSENCKKLLPHINPIDAVKMVIIDEAVPESVKTMPFRPVRKVADFISEVNFLQSREGGDFSVARHYEQSELEYYKAKTLSLLYLQDWKMKNMGVKLAGILKLNGARERLLELATSREKAGCLERLAGGDFKEVGFVRRNSFVSLTKLDAWDGSFEKAALTGLDDPYYEVRIEALKMARANAGKLKERGKFLSAADRLLRDRQFEVAKESVLLIGEIGEEAQFSLLADLSEHFFWQVREAALFALKRMIERKVPCDRAGLKRAASMFILTSTDFKPSFAIKENYRGLMRLLETAE